MNIHNILEDEVILSVNRTFDNLKEVKPDWFTCECEQCRLDTAAYVLNKLSPKYIVSGRGLTHVLSENESQTSIDVDALVMEGLKKVLTHARPFHASGVAYNAKEHGPVFNFPLFIGTICNGLTFEPVNEAILTLTKDGVPCEMIDHTWTNPTTLTSHTRGTYTFWVKPEPVENPNETKRCHFKLEIAAEGFERTVYTFDLPLTASKTALYEPSTINSLKIETLYLFEAELEPDNA